MDDKMLVVNFRCDNCNENFNVVGTDAIKENEHKYHCIYCGTKNQKVYSYDDFYVKRTKKKALI